ncbi:MAG TPA: outer membrane beta-barrel protein [Desulfuromonadales bacterium]|nr:outer membrane beta-barrel protein [Desulfuromonadales bacterium]
MKKSTCLLLLAFACVLVLSATAAAADRYAVGKLGVFFPDESGFDEGPNLEVAMGWGMSEIAPRAVSDNPALADLAIEAGIGAYASDSDSAFGETEFTVMPVTLTGLYRIPLRGTPVEFHAGAGPGLYLAWIETPGDDDLEFEIGLHVQVGADLQLTENLALVTELKANTVTEDIDGAFFNVGLRSRF